MIGYKGFNYKLQGCIDFQFQEGQTYEIEGDLEMCKNGFHFCDMPLNVLDFYPNKYGNKYAIVEALGKVIIDYECAECKKLVTDKIKIVKVITLKELNDLCKNTIFNVKTGNYYFNENGKYHRENDLPAIEYANGTKEWWLNGKLHRENDLPAVEYASGTKHWYQNGELHRDNDLPAIERANGNKEWYQNGKLYRKNDLPAIKYADGSKEWYQNGKLHRDNDLPAIKRADGTKEWYQNGKLHRENYLPAIEYADGRKIWFENGYRYRDNMIHCNIS